MGFAQVVPAHERDVVILEEPEHLNWYHHGKRWNDEYSHVVGIAHTNYLQYARLNNKGTPGEIKEGFTRVRRGPSLLCDELPTLRTPPDGFAPSASRGPLRRTTRAILAALSAGHELDRVLRLHRRRRQAFRDAH